MVSMPVPGGFKKQKTLRGLEAKKFVSPSVLDSQIADSAEMWQTSVLRSSIKFVGIQQPLMLFP